MLKSEHERRGVTNTYTLLASIILQLSALGLAPAMQPQELKEYAAKMEKEEEKIKEMRRNLFDPYVNLNVIKIDMVQLEWYKKRAKEDGIGYYDKYKRRLPNDQDGNVEKFKDNLTDYWLKMAEVAEIKSKKEGSYFRACWLGAGTTYRRMVEPLAIAQYYRVEGNKNYVTKKRPKHFKLLEDWKATSDSTTTSKKNMEDILSKDSCFWAYVEEALLSCKELKVAKEDKEMLKKLVEFEEYVYGQLKKYEVSPEIFLAESSYMRWWNEYKAIKGTSNNSELARFMNDATNLKQYAEGAYDFP
ncbi:senescence-associated carboxylesterase 101-like isoform X2 [Gastrolobium bilobum]|uniref:senescence-associated carboxylesterase 101-like isoform X2 n=1 Tax=Gastrolobium bilobum TaxID=150636 RepID=UPI002AAF8B89|nr:senescence-associated carboxylesterase 101-like isoform X2 [Gastrolobium bilobum]